MRGHTSFHDLFTCLSDLYNLGQATCRIMPKPGYTVTSAISYTSAVLLSFRAYLGFLREAERFAWQHFSTCPKRRLVVSTYTRRASYGPTAGHIRSEHSSALLPRCRLALRISCGYYRINQQLQATIDRVARDAAVSSSCCGDRGTINPGTAAHLA